jgi:hypothetical protein
VKAAIDLVILTSGSFWLVTPINGTTVCRELALQLQPQHLMNAAGAVGCMLDCVNAVFSELSFNILQICNDFRQGWGPKSFPSRGDYSGRCNQPVRPCQRGLHQSDRRGSPPSFKALLEPHPFVVPVNGARSELKALKNGEGISEPDADDTRNGPPPLTHKRSQKSGLQYDADSSEIHESQISIITYSCDIDIIWKHSQVQDVFVR